ncbi:hypothetical protein ACIPJ2_02345 [Curtobacterium sp. NPDC090217]|uniref:hypothetical protein n=1 Tax=Curtobacterium sp. NPDC090217 TaxID=3363970 RepID=UPI0038012B25
MRYEADIDDGTLVIEGGHLVAATPADIAQIGFLDAEQTITWGNSNLEERLPIGLATVAESGPVPISVHAHGTEPPLPVESWTDVVDVTFDVDDIESGLTVVSLFTGPDFDTPPLTPTPGLYRLRISARGREHDWIDTVLEAYRFDAWPIDVAAPPTIHRQHHAPT